MLSNPVQPRKPSLPSQDQDEPTATATPSPRQTSTPATRHRLTLNPHPSSPSTSIVYDPGRATRHPIDCGLFPRAPVPPSRYPVPVTPELWPEPGRARSTTNQSKNHLASHTDDRSRHTALPPPSREDAPALPHADRSQDSLPSGTYKQDKIGAAYTYMRYMRYMR
ncbi:hypothetical protein JX265_007630 [Neoarthrinium moseri]|uniref:Uncharacterized protein n=1 Tax=Neoarthrinium moseri TaxID=1658444 RepID=A0A9P9WJU4_9PEZI|nr:uncharacterized protein JN550_012769 [Neoarthrinium moseri]KAI1858319.1 hypothetical protein JN550_012769 [Neoarthrinium moseri]KAI1867054.1 hypothetical protein JX265_007630 [Neoarthrinium moseri]